MSEAKIVAETDDYIDVQLCGVEEMEVERGMKIGQWSERYIRAAHEVVGPLTPSEGGRLQEASDADFLMIEGSPEELGQREGGSMLADRLLRDIVFAALDACNERGLRDFTAEELTDDIIACWPALNGRDPEELMPFVKEGMQRRTTS